MIGKRFHRLVVTGEAPLAVFSYGSYKRYVCRCDCGKEIITFPSNLNRGATKSCGCWKIETAGDARRTHSKSRTREYNIWTGIKKRCYNPKSSMYPSYGATGIKMCDRWKDSFESFLADMGRQPSSKHSIDRINNKIGYEPSNCRWATPLQQTRNRKCTATIETPFGLISIKELSSTVGIKYFTLYDMAIRRKKSYAQILDLISC